MSLLQTWDKMYPLQEHEDPAVSAIITGTNVDENFWDNFILVCNNKYGLADLLNVSPEKVATWGSRVRNFKKKADQVEPDKVNNKILPTGTL